MPLCNLCLVIWFSLRVASKLIYHLSIIQWGTSMMSPKEAPILCYRVTEVKRSPNRSLVEGFLGAPFYLIFWLGSFLLWYHWQSLLCMHKLLIDFFSLEIFRLHEESLTFDSIPWPTLQLFHQWSKLFENRWIWMKYLKNWRKLVVKKGKPIFFSLVVYRMDY